VTAHAAPRLGVNIDHVATIRNARGGRHPDPLQAAEIAVAAGAHGITAHLREDRRHIRDDDIARLKQRLHKPLNLEMAATAEMTAIALAIRPHAACLVPERREERTTEGGLDVVARRHELVDVVAALGAGGIRVSLFIAPDERQVEGAIALGAPVVELHTGAWCEAVAAGDATRAAAEFSRIAAAAEFAFRLGLEAHAGHGLDYGAAETVSTLPHVVELNIGHFLIGEALAIGLGTAVERMLAAMRRGRAMAKASS
jgi:pyridoxine 5-phosphate synthase